ncbi:MAG: hypothetical protein ACR2K6_00915 [Solirubrobacterales bacterium]
MTLTVIQETSQTDLTDERSVLELGDGSRLVLAAGLDSPILCRLEGHEHPKLNLEAAQCLEGQPFAGYQRLGS